MVPTMVPILSWNKLSNSVIQIFWKIFDFLKFPQLSLRVTPMVVMAYLGRSEGPRDSHKTSTNLQDKKASIVVACIAVYGDWVLQLGFFPFLTR